MGSSLSSNRSARSTPQMFSPDTTVSRESSEASTATINDSPSFIYQPPAASRDDRPPLSVEACIVSHVWDADNYKLDSFGESAIGDDVQARLHTFLDRDPASWSEKLRTRKAKWSESRLMDKFLFVSSFAVEIVGGVGVKGDRPAWLDTLCNHLKLVDECMEQADRQTSQCSFQQSSRRLPKSSA